MKHLMRRLLGAAMVASSLFAAVSSGLAQTPGKDGNLTVNAADTVVNTYTVLRTTVASGATQIRVWEINRFSPAIEAGDLLMLYTARGTNTPTTTNNYNYGAFTLPSGSGAGTYEFVVVTSLGTGGRINIESISGCGGLQYSYTGGSSNIPTQVIRVPQYEDLTISGGGSIVPTPWSIATINSASQLIGGVVVFTVNGTLNLSGTNAISASEAGFRGGVYRDTNYVNGVSDFTTTNVDRAAAKGEGIAHTNVDHTTDGFAARGRGALANGGGGGDSHNAGGGGGANGNNGNGWEIPNDSLNDGVRGGQGVMPSTPPAWLPAWQLDPGYLDNNNQLTNSAGGGRGGYSWSYIERDALTVGPGNALWTGDDRRDVGGLGGRPLDNSPSGRLFFGGGGGAGHCNNQNGSAPSIAGGGNGGGLVFVVATSITGTGSITSNGEQGGDTGTVAPSDAAGGGGAGGAVIVLTNSISDTITLLANGGNGGNQYMPGSEPAECEGPGGGGGGGYVALSTVTGNPARSASGGTYGTTTAVTMTEFAVNGATSGGSGQATESITTINACRGFIRGVVFNDYNGNGVRDVGEPVLPNVSVTVTQSNNATINLVTDSNGSYEAQVLTGATDAEVDINDPDVPTGSVVTSTAQGGTALQSRTIHGLLLQSNVDVGLQQRVPVPTLSIEARDDSGVINEIGPGTEFFYRIYFSNISTGTSPLARAYDPTLTLTLPRVGQTQPLELQYFTQNINGGFTGNTSYDGNGNLTFTLNENIGTAQAPLYSGYIDVYVKTDNPIAGNDTLIAYATLNSDNSGGSPLTTLNANYPLDVDPLLVDLTYFFVDSTGADPVVKWGTSAEYDTLGFDVLLAENQEGVISPGTVITPSTIPAQGSETSGSDYSFTDTTPIGPKEKRGYYLRETELAGMKFYGPVFIQRESVGASNDQWVIF